MFLKQNGEHVAAEEFDGEFVLINFARGTYFSLKNTAVDIWRQFENGAAADQVRDRLAARFDVPADVVTPELQRCLRVLLEEELLCETDNAGAAVETWSSPTWQAPTVEVYSDLQDLIVLDPVHEVDDAFGWPRRNPEGSDA